MLTIFVNTMKCFAAFAAGLAIVIAPARSETIKGKVTDFDTQGPLAGVKVKALESDSTLTASDGSFELTFQPAALGEPFRRGRAVPRTGLEGRVGDGGYEVTYTLRDLRGASVGQAMAIALDRGRHGMSRQYAQNWLFLDMRASGPLSKSASSVLAPAALAKASAVHRIAFEAEGYVRAVQQINGSHDSLRVTLKKSGQAPKLAQLTWYTSYPDPNSEECVQYNGCTWAGQFAALNGKQPESWVKANNIAAVHEKDFATYKLKTLRLTQGYRQIDVKVYDMCSDSDCNGCCTQNAKPSGFLIDIESYTSERFESGSGQVSWICLDCD
jgi:hypothetical protein